MRTTWLTHNFWIKIGALILASSLWLYVAGEETVQAELKIPIDFVLAEGMVVTEQVVDMITVSVSGRKDIISKLAEEELVCKVDFTNYEEPLIRAFTVERGILPLDPEISVLGIIPNSLEVKIDKLIQKVVPIKVMTEGEPAPGCKVEGFVIDPISAIIKGPEGYLKDMVYIDTEPVDVTGRLKSFKKMVPLKSIPMIGEKAPPQFVEVVVKIIEED